MPTIGPITLQRTLDTVSEIPSCNSELADISGMSRSTMHAALGMLVVRGRIDRVKAHKPPSGGRALWFRPLYYLPGSDVSGTLARWKNEHSIHMKTLTKRSHSKKVVRDRLSVLTEDPDRERIFSDAARRRQHAREHWWAEGGKATMSTDYLRRCRDYSNRKRRNG